MITVRIVNGVVHEIIPVEATVPNVAYWYGEEFAAECVEAPDEVLQNWTYDGTTFAAPRIPVPDPISPTAWQLCG